MARWKTNTIAVALWDANSTEIVFVTSDKFDGAVEDVYLEAVRKLWNAENHPAYLVGPAWAQTLLARFANCADAGDGRVHVHHSVKEIAAHNGSLAFVTPAFSGRSGERR